ncbi:hypothetical protein Bhyg_06023 [Pseudolycoriella hygida]|uniref:Uncharacterized protein n=1 Tax=Pseudolycoriella hygida TaxID=35572 RepID=A0A9Q0MZS3_9DIPT|nr:hypothetical protein Bhyg_06023 [Pseudolycoriella hygida]
MMQKLYVLIIVIYFVQLSYGAAITEENKPCLVYLTDEEINHFRNLMLTVRGVTNDTIETLERVLNIFRKGATSHERSEGGTEFVLLFLSMGNNNMTEGDWMTLFYSNRQETELSDALLAKFRKEISTKASVEETEKVIQVLQNFKGASSTPDERKKALMELITYGISGAIEKSYNDVQNVITLQEES